MQSKRHSLEETCISTAVGLIVSTLLNMFVVPVILNTEVTLASNVTLTAMFTVASLARGYCIRRFYNERVIRAQAE